MTTEMDNHNNYCLFPRLADRPKFFRPAIHRRATTIKRDHLNSLVRYQGEREDSPAAVPPTRLLSKAQAQIH